MTAEEKLQELYEERNCKVITDSKSGIVTIRGQGSVCIAPTDIDLIADLVVERLKEVK